MKEDLLKMLEWHTVARAEAPVDVRYIGTRMKEWVDEAAWRQVHDIFGRFDAHEAWRALLATVNLFSRIARETAEASGLAYPEGLERNVRAYLAGYDGHFNVGLPAST
ncbi:MAG: aminoglycoside 6-adenylyltransferase [Conexibacter sp.]